MFIKVYTAPLTPTQTIMCCFCFSRSTSTIVFLLWWQRRETRQRKKTENTAMGRVLVEEQSTVAICSEMDSEWVHCGTVEWVHCSGPKSGIQLLADTINYCCPGWSSAHTATTTTTTTADTTMMMNRGRRMSLMTRHGNDASGAMVQWSIGDWPSEKLDKVRGRWWIDY